MPVYRELGGRILTEITFVVKSKVDGDTGFGAIDWEEITT